MPTELFFGYHGVVPPFSFHHLLQMKDPVSSLPITTLKNFRCKEVLAVLLKYLNGIHHCIQFKTEKEIEGKPPFSNVLLKIPANEKHYHISRLNIIT